MAVSTQSRSPFDAAHSQVALSEINITPLIDVMLVLLIIFMVIAPVVTRPLDARLPQPVPPEPLARTIERVEVIAQGTGLFSLDGNPLPGPALADALAMRLEQVRAAGSEPVLMVGASADADYQAFTDALAAARATGIEDIGYAP